MNPAIIKRSRIQLGASHGVPAQGRAGAAGTSRRPGACATGDAKSVRLLELEGRVRAVELTCSCGEVTVIELEYPDDSRPQEEPS